MTRPVTSTACSHARSAEDHAALSTAPRSMRPMQRSDPCGVPVRSEAATPPIMVDFLDLSAATRASVLAEMRRAFGMHGAARPCDSAARWWFAKVALLDDGAGAIVLPRRGMRPAYLDKLWASIPGRGSGDRILSHLVAASGTLHWRSTADRWYINWAARRGAALHHWPHGKYSYMRAGPAARCWEAEDASRDWLTMPSAWSS